jgi:salicylate hydroxylase
MPPIITGRPLPRHPESPDRGCRSRERYAGWHESLLRLFAAADTWYKWALYDRDPIPQWTRGRATILGDAAHPMLPYLGQGACQAIEDGVVLVTALSAEAADPLTGLARYERTRRREQARWCSPPASGG